MVVFTVPALFSSVVRSRGAASSAGAGAGAGSVDDGAGGVRKNTPPRLADTWQPEPAVRLGGDGSSIFTTLYQNTNVARRTIYLSPIFVSLVR